MKYLMTNFTLENFIENKGMFGLQTYLFNLVLDGVGSHPQASAVISPLNKPAILRTGYRVGQRPVWTGAEKNAPTCIRSPDRPACSYSQYRLSYPRPLFLFQLAINL